MAEFIIGIDVGLSGGLAVLGSKAEVVPTPTLAATKTRRAYDVPGMVNLLRGYGATDVLAFLERVPVNPGPGILRLASLMEGFGLWKGILSTVRMPFVLVSAHEWQKVLLKGYPTNDYKERKSSSVLAAKQLYPTVNLVLDGCKKPHDGMADALLIATYGRATYGENDRGG